MSGSEKSGNENDYLPTIVTRQGLVGGEETQQAGQQFGLQHEDTTNPAGVPPLAGGPYSPVHYGGAVGGHDMSVSVDLASAWPAAQQQTHGSVRIPDVAPPEGVDEVAATTFPGVAEAYRSPERQPATQTYRPAEEATSYSTAGQEPYAADAEFEDAKQEQDGHAQEAQTPYGGSKEVVMPKGVKQIVVETVTAVKDWTYNQTQQVVTEWLEEPEPVVRAFEPTRTVRSDERGDDMTTVEQPSVTSTELVPSSESTVGELSVTDRAHFLLRQYVDDLILNAGSHLGNGEGLGEWIAASVKGSAERRWQEGQEELRTSTFGLSSRQQQRQPGELERRRREARRMLIDEAAATGVREIVDLSVPKDEATKRAWALLGVDTYPDHIAGYREARGEEVDAAIDRITANAESSSWRTSGSGILLERTDTYWQVKRTNGQVGKIAEVIILLADPDRRSHYVIATKKHKIQAPGEAPASRNMVTGFKLNPLATPEAVTVMGRTAKHTTVYRQETEDFFSLRAKPAARLSTLGRFAVDEGAVGRRQLEPVNIWEPDQELQRPLPPIETAAENDQRAIES